MRKLLTYMATVWTELSQLDVVFFYFKQFLLLVFYLLSNASTIYLTGFILTANLLHVKRPNLNRLSGRSCWKWSIENFFCCRWFSLLLYLNTVILIYTLIHVPYILAFLVLLERNRFQHIRLFASNSKRYYTRVSPFRAFSPFITFLSYSCLTFPINYLLILIENYYMFIYAG